MLESFRRGYAVMKEDLSAYSFESESIKECLPFVRPGYVVVERIPVTYGYRLILSIHPFHKLFKFKRSGKHILWFHWDIQKIWTHKCGKIVIDYENCLAHPMFNKTTITR